MRWYYIINSPYNMCDRAFNKILVRYSRTVCIARRPKRKTVLRASEPLHRRRRVHVNSFACPIENACKYYGYYVCIAYIIIPDPTREIMIAMCIIQYVPMYIIISLWRSPGGPVEDIVVVVAILSVTRLYVRTTRKTMQLVYRLFRQILSAKIIIIILYVRCYNNS